MDENDLPADLSYNEIAHRRNGKTRLRWKPWPDLIVAIGGFVLLLAWLGWIVWMMVVPGTW